MHTLPLPIVQIHTTDKGKLPKVYTYTYVQTYWTYKLTPTHTLPLPIVHIHTTDKGKLPTTRKYFFLEKSYIW